MGTASPTTSLVFAALVCGTLAAATLDLSGGLRPAAPRLLWISLVGFVAYMTRRTGRTSRWRALLFVAMAWGFVWQFKSRSLGLGGRLFTTSEAVEVPYCHIAIASYILNHAYNHYLALRSGHWFRWGPLSLGFLWLVVTLVLGQAWCSWACFYGGIDEGFSRILRKPLLRLEKLPGRLRDLPAAVLLVSALFSLTMVLPAFCLWACPLKLTTAFLDPNDLVRKVQLAVFLALAAAAMVIGPLLTKKRWFCGLICPFGAWQALFGNLNPFRVAIRPEACSQCQLCLKVCPTFAIEPEGLKAHVISAYCNRCGECVDACPTGAIGYALFHDPTRDARPLFLFCALVVGGAVGALFLP